MESVVAKGFAAGHKSIPMLIFGAIAGIISGIIALWFTKALNSLWPMAVGILFQVWFLLFLIVALVVVAVVSMLTKKVPSPYFITTLLVFASVMVFWALFNGLNSFGV